MTASNGDLLLLSKENISNGCISTVDLTYPAAPFYLIYNPELEKGMMNDIFHYSESGKWTKPFAAHDVGTYPFANGEVYGGDMPVEESGNMLILTAAIAAVEGNADYAAKHWEVLTTGQTIWWKRDLILKTNSVPMTSPDTLRITPIFPSRQFWELLHTGYLAEMLGKKDVAETSTTKARQMATEWERMANDGDHYRLTFDKPGTWSQKYNLVWDRLLGLDIFDSKIAETEIPYYLRSKIYMVCPSTIVRHYTKTDWIMWTATMAPDQATFREFIVPVHKFMNDNDRPRADVRLGVYRQTQLAWLQGRSVIGGYYMKMLEGKLMQNKQ